MTMDQPERPSRILLIDSYDSFTLNLSSLIAEVTRAEVVTIHNDSVDPNTLIENYLKFFDAVVIGPGPGSPDIAEDVGVIPHLLNLSTIENGLLPIFGVCLGFQSLVLSTSGKVIRLPEPNHGQVASIEHSGNDIFEGITENFDSVRYHSLHGIIPNRDSEDTTTDEHIIPLAWTKDIHCEDKVLMAGKHSSKPFWGVQYHPESICSKHGGTVIQNFWKLAREWAQTNGRLTKIEDSDGSYSNLLKLYSIKPHAFKTDISKEVSDESTFINAVNSRLEEVTYLSTNLTEIQREYETKISTNYATVLICEELHKSGQEFVLMNSAANPGRWSIIGLIEPGKTICIKHYNEYDPDYVFVHPFEKDTKKRYASIPENEKRLKLGEGSNNGIWGFLSSYMSPKIERYKKSINIDGRLKSSGEYVVGMAPPGALFCGGLTGYLSYEAPQNLDSYPSKIKLQKLTASHTELNEPLRPYPDVNMVDIEKCILLDSETGTAYVLSLVDKPLNQPPKWMQETCSLIESTLVKYLKGEDKLEIPNMCHELFKNVSADEEVKIEMPNKDHYIDHIKKCQEELRAGNSYELCLTAQTKIILPEPIDSWDLYKILYKRNPAPYSCLFDFPEATLCGSSPERFMNWSGTTGKCQFRPIKGTVKKGPHVTFESASAILNTPKERGENLMIVDLIRHDLNSLLSNVQVKKLMGVEEYKTVYQLVSVITGDLNLEANKGYDTKSYSGFDVLIHSLPPGSMTGAPKIRSVEILRELEDWVPRGIYSGVSGYWSVLDEGDWSVIIRSAFRYKNEVSPNEPNSQIWRIGAGGAITILSDPEDEWHEMSIKLESALQAFS